MMTYANAHILRSCFSLEMKLFFIQMLLKFWPLLYTLEVVVPIYLANYPTIVRACTLQPQKNCSALFAKKGSKWNRFHEISNHISFWRWGVSFCVRHPLFSFNLLLFSFPYSLELGLALNSEGHNVVICYFWQTGTTCKSRPSDRPSPFSSKL